MKLWSNHVLRVQIHCSDWRDNQSSGAPEGRLRAPALQRGARSELPFLQLQYPEVHILHLASPVNQMMGAKRAGLVAEGPSSKAFGAIYCKVGDSNTSEPTGEE